MENSYKNIKVSYCKTAYKSNIFIEFQKFHENAIIYPRETGKHRMKIVKKIEIYETKRKYLKFS